MAWLRSATVPSLPSPNSVAVVCFCHCVPNISKLLPTHIAYACFQGDRSALVHSSEPAHVYGILVGQVQLHQRQPLRSVLRLQRQKLRRP